MTDLKVVTIHESNFRDPVATLRVIAKEIEDGTYSKVETVGIVMMSEQGLTVFGLGPYSDASHISLLMQAAINRFARAIEEYDGSDQHDDNGN
jgi:hypothetical protein